MLVHRLEQLNTLVLPQGQLELATEEDWDLLTQWTLNFQEDARIFPKKTWEQTKIETKAKIEKGSIYKWVQQEETLSIAAIMRKTPNAGFVGLVYTPPPLRGKAYATACVYRLSEQILQGGSRYCGLFTDVANPASNHVYKKIGYVSMDYFNDIQFE